MSHPSRKKTFVDPQVQGALVRRLVFHWLGFFAVASLIAFCLQVLANPFRSLDQHFEQLWWTHGPFLLVMVFLLPVFVVDTVRLSNRFSGPIYRLRKTIQNIAQGGAIRPLKFRDFDFWQDLAVDFNQMIERLSQNDVTSDQEESKEESEEHTTLTPLQ
jgi:nitrogen fixation/metabolism regulation signal transduction histidine kinase